jgi:predicted transcriptional regulator
MTTLKVGIASYEDMKARTLRIARGERPARGAPKVWFTSTESFSKVLSAGNRELLRIIAEKAPGSLDELVELTGRKSRTCRARSRQWRATDSFGSCAVNAGGSRRR